jgi:hypothetical protein
MLHARERLAHRSRSRGNRARLAPQVIEGDLAFALHDDHVAALVLAEAALGARSSAAVTARME